MNTIHLGYEIGTGAAVELPPRNMCITGQTQEAGKTTALEALVHRSGLRAIAFVTKRHESGFSNAHRIPPYFRERADWQFVVSILESTLKQRMNFQRSWIMKLCEYQPPKSSRRGAGSPGWNTPRSLADVAGNVEIALQTATGIHEGVYTELRGFLKLVVPQIERLPYSDELRLGPGLNVMNLVEYSEELQALVIRSVLEWNYEHETDTVTVIPEAWQFLPQKRGNPVKLAAEALIRKGSAGRNFLWLDSQDLSNVDKDIVRSCPVMLLGVQRERNEVKRTIDHIPDIIQVRPKPSDIMTLGLGEFVACYGKTINRVYVQPKWLDADRARDLAMADKRDPRQIAKLYQPKTIATESSDDDMYQAQYEAERRKTAELQRQVDELEGKLRAVEHPAPAKAAAPPAEPTAPIRGEGVMREVRSPMPPPALNGDIDYEALYAYIIDRARSEPPATLAVLISKPEIEVQFKREVIQVEGTTVRGRIAELIADGFFDSRKTGGAIYSAVISVGLTCSKPAIYQTCDDLTVKRFLTKTKDAGRHIQYQAVAGMKVNIVGK